MKINRIAIVEYHILISEIFKRILSEQEDIEVVWTENTILQAKKSIEKNPPDLLIIDFLLPDGSGISLLEFIKEKFPNLKTLFLTAMIDENAIISAIEAGADGYITKSSSFDSLINSIRLIIANESVFDSSILKPLFKKIFLPNLKFDLDNHNNKTLSFREKEIVLLVSLGSTDKEIAQKLSISINTTKTHLRRIFKKLNISSRKELQTHHHLSYNN